MKMIHTGDWHIGKLVHGMHMTRDQEQVLEQFTAHLREKRPDVVLLAGDIYDRTIPPVEAVELLDRVLTEIVLERKIPVIAISGNHDSGERLGFAGGILQRQGLHIHNRLEQVGKPVVLEDGHGPVHFYPIPYADPAEARVLYGDETIRTHDDVFRAVMERIRPRMDRNVRNVCIAHGFVGGLELAASESERPLSIGGTETVDRAHFDGFHYVALGHLHRPQKAGRDRIRYAGSLMKYSFSEAEQPKGMLEVELDGEGGVELESVVFPPPRDMRVIRGELANLVRKDVYEAQNCQDFIMAVLTDEGELHEPMATLRSVYPNILKLERGMRTQVGSGEMALVERDYAAKAPLDIFRQFYGQVEGEAMEAVQEELLKDVLRDVEKGGVL
ncbi:exonuclease SbcCD subunit D [Anaerotalea alkaliphila]|uniref:Nuclease SbcCD subunit D n=1 Tax=Anaerotalea alkaliphila TaxID=2662126 RepID=A0A7X5HX36_9FIRM|nr:exonuclease SbcCD subunit D [Anaerotalea alkaliphila]NDL68263.1 exonuclease SbcCD subunit D [Anaerotalea alkaliphila]